MAYITNLKVNNKKRKLPAGIILGLFLIAVFFIFGRSLSPLILKMFSPILKYYNGVTLSLSRGFRFLEPKSVLISENETLKKKINELEAQNIGYDILVSENDILSSISSGSQFITTFAISFPPRMPYDTILLDKGGNAGVREGAIVYLGERVMVGKIESISSSSSKMRLLSSSGIKTESIIMRTGAPVELLGLGGFNFRLELTKGFDVEVGDLIVLPSLPQVAIAEVVFVGDDNVSPFLRVLLTTPLPISGISPLYIER